MMTTGMHCPLDVAAHRSSSACLAAIAASLSQILYYNGTRSLDTTCWRGKTWKEFQSAIAIEQTIYTNLIRKEHPLLAKFPGISPDPPFRIIISRHQRQAEGAWGSEWVQKMPKTVKTIKVPVQCSPPPTPIQSANTRRIPKASTNHKTTSFCCHRVASVHRRSPDSDNLEEWGCTSSKLHPTRCHKNTRATTIHSSSLPVPYT